MLKIYVAHAMTGREKSDLVAETTRVAEAAAALNRLREAKIELLDPVVAEGVKAELGKVNCDEALLRQFWRRDKEMIREAHVLIDVTGPAKSEGVAHEIGYARFGLWKPVVRVYPNLATNSVAQFEDDLVVDTVEAAFFWANVQWGTRAKRLLWRWRMINRCLPRWLWHQIREWK